MATVMIPVSVGELIDKITILELKLRHISDPAKRGNVAREHAALAAIWEGLERPGGVEDAVEGLRRVNAALWEVEDTLREDEAAGVFGDGFVARARSVYRLNDERAALKREVNRLTGSELVEEKSYKGS
jgi:hypothetical protein